MMLLWIRRSLFFYCTKHAVVAGIAALTAVILCATLLTGHSLQRVTWHAMQARLGAIQEAVLFQKTSIPVELVQTLPKTQTALFLRGELLDAQGDVCATQVQIIGIPSPSTSTVPTLAVLNQRARAILPDNEGAIRFVRPSGFSVELPLGETKTPRLIRRALRFATIEAQNDAPLFNQTLIPPDFALAASTLPPVNVFVPYPVLAEAAGMAGHVNLIVTPEQGTLGSALEARLTPDVTGLILATSHRTTTLKSRALYLPSSLIHALADQDPALERATFHLADALTANGVETPYGFVAAVTPSTCGTPRDMKDDEVVINAWLAEKLALSTNQLLTLGWRRFESDGRLVPDTRMFRVRSILPMTEASQAKDLMPVFPGMEGVDTCAAWDVGLPMDAGKLNDPANEAYWKQWRETPKALLTFAAGTNCFGTLFGEAMSARTTQDPQTIRRLFSTHLTYADKGFQLFPLKTDGEKAARGSTDFTALFMGMAFILIVTALMLTSFALALTLETRKKEIALLAATGWTRARITGFLSGEHLPPIFLATFLGAAAGSLLARGMVWGILRFWQNAFAGAAVVFRFSASVTIWAALLGFGLTSLILVLTVRRFTACQPAELWKTSGEGMSDLSAVSSGVSSRRQHFMNATGSLLAISAIATLLFSARGQHTNGAFFGAGFLLLTSLLIFLKSTAEQWRHHGREKIGAARAGFCRAIQMPHRSTPVVVLLAIGTFLVLGILAMKQDPAAGCERSSSGGGGFAAIVTSVTPFERERGLAMARRVTGAKTVIPIRVRDGDEAGCLNMNAPVTPQVLGIAAADMAKLRAFEPERAGGVWSPLMQSLPHAIIPALAADQTMLHYSLKAQASPLDGTRFTYPGGRLQVVGALPVRSSILQGALIIDEASFTACFPATHGYQMWLCDYAPYRLREALDPKRADGRKPVSSSERARLRHPEPGVTVETVEERLRRFGAVESTYLDMFLILGGLGLVLGVVGAGLFILRGIEERRSELALLTAIGIPRKQIFRLIATEYGLLVFTGLGAGLPPAWIAIQPAAQALGSAMPWGAMIGVLLLLLGTATLCVLSVTFWATSRTDKFQS